MAKGGKKVAGVVFVVADVKSRAVLELAGRELQDALAHGAGRMQQERKKTQQVQIAQRAYSFAMRCWCAGIDSAPATRHGQRATGQPDGRMNAAGRSKTQQGNSASEVSESQQKVSTGKWQESGTGRFTDVHKMLTGKSGIHEAVSRAVSTESAVTKVRLPRWLTGKRQFPDGCQSAGCQPGCHEKAGTRWTGTQAGTHGIGPIGDVTKVVQAVTSRAAALDKDRARNRRP